MPNSTSTTAPPAPVVVDLEIGGMSCGACAARIERRLDRLDGIAATVDYAAGTARVVLTDDDPDGPDVEAAARRAVATVTGLGYAARPVHAVGPVRPPSR